jgi:ParB/RepB/Spo0J family partition protein
VSMFDTQTVEVPVDDIVVGMHIKNIRTFFRNEDIDSLAESIETVGLMSPLVIMHEEDADGNAITELVAGERRLRAIKKIQERDPDFLEDGVPCVQFEGLLKEAKFVNAIENIDRENVDDVDLSQWIWDRVQDGETQSTLADRLHRSVSWISMRMTFHEKAADAVKEALREGLISFSAAYELSKNLSQEDQIKWIEKARRLNKKITVEQAAAAGDPDKVKKPGKRAREKMITRADHLTDIGNDVGRGISMGLRWAEGLLEDEDMQDMVQHEESKT